MIVRLQQCQSTSRFRHFMSSSVYPVSIPVCAVCQRLAPPQAGPSSVFMGKVHIESKRWRERDLLLYKYLHISSGYIEEVNPNKFSTQVEDPLTAAINKVDKYIFTDTKIQKYKNYPYFKGNRFYVNEFEKFSKHFFPRSFLYLVYLRTVYYFIFTVFTVRSAAPLRPTALWGGSGPRFEPGTGDLVAGTLTNSPPHILIFSFIHVTICRLPGVVGVSSSSQVGWGDVGWRGSTWTGWPAASVSTIFRQSTTHPPTLTQ